MGPFTDCLRQVYDRKKKKVRVYYQNGSLSSQSIVPIFNLFVCDLLRSMAEWILYGTGFDHGWNAYVLVHKLIVVIFLVYALDVTRQQDNDSSQVNNK
jgi:hypothetical protein